MNENRLELNVLAYSFLSGLLACLVSIFIKIAFNTDLLLIVENFYLKLLVQTAFVCTSFLLNSLMWLFYSKSLHLSTNTLYSTALNKFANFICSALFGYFLFNEKLNFFRWLFGLTVLFIGILILNSNNQNVQTGQSKISKDK